MKNYELEPYEVILSEWYRLNKQLLRITIWLIVYFFVLFVGIVLSMFGRCDFLVEPTYLLIGSSFLACGAWTCAMWQYQHISTIRCKRYREIEDAITPELEAIARMWYGRDWHKALRECIEAHFPGDCPLCGAE